MFASCVKLTTAARKPVWESVSSRPLLIAMASPGNILLRD
jgi:hypothetical protein